MFIVINDYIKERFEIISLTVWVKELIEQNKPKISWRKEDW